MKSVQTVERSDMFPSFSPMPILLAGVVLLVELTGIGFAFKHAIDFTCAEHWPRSICAGLNGTMLALYCSAAALALLALLKPHPFRSLLETTGSRYWPIGVNLAGLVLTLLPLLFLSAANSQAVLIPVLAVWAVGMTLLLAGFALFLAPPVLWRNFLTATWRQLVPVLAVAFAAPWLSDQLRPIWRMDTISDATFSAVVRLLGLMGYAVTADPVRKVIGDGDFSIRVAPQCSGIEGLALVTVFVSLYLWLFRHDLRFPRALLLYPIGLATSAVFNVLRIALLLAIGIEGNPALAVGGFHSHAGWLMFTLVALGIVGLAQSVPALRKEQAKGGVMQSAAPSLPILSDPVVARLLPFAIFMFSALLAQVLSQSPGVVYPARVLLMVAVLAVFLPIYVRLPWRIDPVAAGIGVLIGVAWVLVPVPPADSAPYGTLSGTMLVAWFVLRGIGTVLLVPVIEELFFRGYLERLLSIGSGMLWSVFSAVVTSALFAALHDRWAEAFVAGLLLSWVMRRRGNICDAIIAHAIANAVVFAGALLTGNLAII